MNKAKGDVKLPSVHNSYTETGNEKTKAWLPTLDAFRTFADECSPATLPDVLSSVFGSDGGARMRTAIYARVSTTDQNCELQIRELQQYAERQGWGMVETYQDTISGAYATRPGLNRLMARARARRFDCLLFGSWTDSGAPW